MSLWRRRVVLTGHVLLMSSTLALVGQAQKADLRLMNGTTRVIAHRGGTGPDNTVANGLKSIALGISFLELDVQLTKDGVAVLIHDATVDRTTNGSGKVSDMTFEQIRRLDAGTKYRDALDPGRSFAGEKVPTPQEMLRAVGDRAVLLLQIHSAPEAKAVIKAIQDQGAFHRAVLRSADDALLRTIKSADSRVLTGIWGVTIPDDDALGALIARLSALGVAALNVANEERLTQPVVNAFHRAGIAVWGRNTVDSARWQRLHAAGVDGIQTDDPGALQKWLSEQSATRSR
jgi:glycerophosphoryl diester phosphodiesterase